MHLIQLRLAPCVSWVPLGGSSGCEGLPRYFHVGEGDLYLFIRLFIARWASCVEVAGI